MATSSARYPQQVDVGLEPDMTDADLWVLNVMRCAECDPVTSVVFDLFETCELLELDRHTSLRTYAVALALSLEDALGHPPGFLASGQPELSFDEFWLMRLIERSRCHDAESVAFLISSRVAPLYRNALAFLIEGLVVRLELQDLSDLS